MLGGTVKGPNAPEDRTRNSPGQRCAARPSLEGAAVKAADPLWGTSSVPGGPVRWALQEPGWVHAPTTADGWQLAVSCLVPGGCFHSEDDVMSIRRGTGRKCRLFDQVSLPLTLRRLSRGNHLSTFHSPRAAMKHGAAVHVMI